VNFEKDIDLIHDSDQIAIFSYYSKKYSRAGVYISPGIRESNKQTFYQVPRGIFKSIRYLAKVLRELKSSRFRIVVISQSHLLVVVLKLLTRKQVTLDAGWSLTEAELARWKNFGSLPKLIKIYLIDFVAFKLANKIILESSSQSRYISRIFFVRRQKLFTLFTGFDENSFKDKSTCPNEIENLNLNNKSIILFRGSYTKESGLDLVAEISVIERDTSIIYVIACSNLPTNLVFGDNAVVIARRISNSEMKFLYENATICIGQISARPRLRNTIPHKAFEAGYFGKPYISADGVAIKELYSDEECIYLDEVTSNSLGIAIAQATGSDSLQIRLSENIQKNYRHFASQELLAKKFNRIITI